MNSHTNKQANNKGWKSSRLNTADTQIINDGVMLELLTILFSFGDPYQTVRFT